jgi:polar amino acid transport system substrate-binding protein
VRGYRELETTPNVMLFTVGRSDARENHDAGRAGGHFANRAAVSQGRGGRAAGLGALYSRPVGAYRGSIFADAAAAGFVEVDLAPTPQVSAKMLGGRYDLWVEGSFVVGAVLKDIRQPLMRWKWWCWNRWSCIWRFRGTSGKMIQRWYEALAA